VTWYDELRQVIQWRRHDPWASTYLAHSPRYYLFPFVGGVSVSLAELREEFLVVHYQGKKDVYGDKSILLFVRYVTLAPWWWYRWGSKLEDSDLVSIRPGL
jgi:hypothetical protein